jgi:thiazole tautomerase (transcriptional regulator TenI)
MAIVGRGGARSAGAAIRGGADFVQVRAKELGSRALLTLVREVIAEVGRKDAVLVNSRPDVAELAGARGVHLPERGLDPRAVRLAFPGLLIGVSCHDGDGLARAADAGADFALIGPVFETPGKESRALGPSRLEELLRGLTVPVLAVGGVTPERVDVLRRCGMRGVAAIRPFVDPRGAETLSIAFRQALDGAGRSSPSLCEAP